MRNFPAVFSGFCGFWPMANSNTETRRRQIGEGLAPIGGERTADDFLNGER